MKCHQRKFSHIEKSAQIQEVANKTQELNFAIFLPVDIADMDISNRILKLEACGDHRSLQ